MSGADVDRCEHTLDTLRCILNRGHDLCHTYVLSSEEGEPISTILTGPPSTPTPEMRAQAAMLGHHEGPALMVRLPATPIETIPTEVACVPSDTTIASLARAHAASIMEWNRAHATTEPSHEDAMAIFERRDRTLFALLDALHPGWRDVYDAAWGEEGRARRAAARADAEGQASP